MKASIAIEYVGLDVLGLEGTAQTDGRGAVGLMLASALRNQGHRVDVFVPGPRRIHPPFSGQDALRIVSEDRFPARAQDGTSYGALIVNDWNVVNRLPGVPVVYCPHEIERLRRMRIGTANEAAVAGQDKMFEASDWIWVPSRDIGDFLIHVAGIPMTKVIVESFGIDCELFKPMNREAARQRLRLNPESKIVLFVGCLEQRKGLNVLREAFQSIEDDGPIQLVVVGGEGPRPSREDRDAAQEFLAWARSETRAERVLIRGQQPWTLLPDYYAAANVCAFPSLMEPFGLPTAEALACGAPIVGSDIDGFRQLVRHETDGLLTPPGDSTAFAWGLRRALEEPYWESEEAISQRRNHALTFCWDAVASRLAARTFSPDRRGVSKISAAPSAQSRR